MQRNASKNTVSTEKKLNSGMDQRGNQLREEFSRQFLHGISDCIESDFGRLTGGFKVIPALATYLFRRSVDHKSNKLIDAIDAGYKKSLSAALKAKKAIVITAVALFIGSMALVPFLGTEFVPELEEGTVNIRVTLAPSSSLETSLEVAQTLERKLMEFPDSVWDAFGAASDEVVREPMDDELYKTCYDSYMASLRSSAAWGSRSEGAFTRQRNRVVGI